MALTKVSSGLMKPDNNLELEYTSQLGTTSVVGAATGYVVRTNYYDANVTAGSGATFKFTGVTTLGKAGNVPDADGYFYDAVGRQFEVVGSPVNVLWFGAVGDGVSDDTAAIQAAVDSAQNTVKATFGINVPEIYFPAGTYAISTNITKKSASWIGAGVDATTFKWNGTAAVTAITQDATVRGGVSATTIEKMSFYDGSAKPLDWLSIPNGVFGVDFGFRLSELRFKGTTRYHLNIVGYVNAHFSNLRFDSWNSFAISITTIAGQNLSTFVLDKFTADHMTGSTAEGFIIVDNTAAVTNMGTLRICNGRYENNAALTGRKAFIVSYSNTGDYCSWQLDNITYQDVGNATTGDALIHRDGVAGSEKVTISNLLINSLDNIFTGTYPTDWPGQNIPVASMTSANIDRQVAVVIPQTSSGNNAGIEVYTRDTGSKLGYRLFRGAEGFPRYELGSDGVIKLGNGTVAPDVVLRGRQALVADATGGATIDAEARTAINSLLARLRTHGIIAT